MRLTLRPHLLVSLGALLAAGVVAIPAFFTARSETVASQGVIGNEPTGEPLMLEWDTVLGTNGPTLKRAKVPGGWLLALPDGEGVALTYYADPFGTWGADRTGVPRPRRAK